MDLHEVAAFDRLGGSLAWGRAKDHHERGLGDPSGPGHPALDEGDATALHPSTTAGEHGGFGLTIIEHIADRWDTSAAPA